MKELFIENSFLEHSGWVEDLEVGEAPRRGRKPKSAVASREEIAGQRLEVAVEGCEEGIPFHMRKVKAYTEEELNFLNTSPKVDRIILSKLLSQRTQLSRMYSRYIVDVILELLVSSLLGGKEVELRGLGRFYMRYKNAKKAQNVHKRETIFVEAHYEPTFKMSRSLRLEGRMSVARYEELQKGFCGGKGKRRRGKGKEGLLES
jgi:DNA-binding protein HU-beta